MGTLTDARSHLHSYAKFRELFYTGNELKESKKRIEPQSSEKCVGWTCTLALLHSCKHSFSLCFHVIDIPPIDRQMEMSPRGIVFLYRDGSPFQVQSPKGHGAELLGHFSVGSDFAEDEIKKKLGLS